MDGGRTKERKPCVARIDLSGSFFVRQALSISVSGAPSQAKESAAATFLARFALLFFETLQVFFVGGHPIFLDMPYRID